MLRFLINAAYTMNGGLVRRQSKEVSVSCNAVLLSQRNETGDQANWSAKPTIVPIVPVCDRGEQYPMHIVRYSHWDTVAP